jgi:hypothetical protein
MNRGEEHIKKNLFWVMIALWFIPWIQGRFDIINEKSLKGAIEKKSNPILNESTWWHGDFQKSKEAYLNDEFGFRPYFIRLNNQVEFWLFNKVRASHVIKGKEGYLYEYNYIKTYYGLDFIGEDAIEKRFIQLKKIQDSLASRGKTFILAIAASKGQFYPEFFPDSSIHSKSTTNYEIHVKKAREHGINLLDFNAYFLANKKQSEHILYSKQGIHWTYYGACLVADSLIHYIEEKRNIDMPELHWDRIVQEPSRNDDKDIALALNLLFPLKDQVLSYPEISYEKDETKTRPSAMVISDSYYWSLFNLNIPQVFSKNQFWYYYSQIYESGIEGMKEANNSLLRLALHDFDVVILLSTDANLYNLGWEFIERAETVLENNSARDIEFERKVQNLRAYIPTDSAWIKDIRIKADKKGISVDSMILLDALYIIEQEMKKEIGN